MRLILTVLTLLTLAGEGHAAALDTDMPGSHLGTGYYGIYSSGHKIGWARMSTSAERGFIKSAMEMFLQMENEEGLLEIVIQRDEVFDDQPPFSLKGIREQNQSGSEIQLSTLMPDGDRFLLTTSTPATVDSEITHPMDVMGYSLIDVLGMDILAASNPELGATVEVISLDLLEGKTSTLTATLISNESIMQQGVSTRLLTLSMHDSILGSLGEAIYLPTGRAVRLELGSLLEMRFEPEAVAKKLDAPVDLFTQGLAQVDQPLGAPFPTQAEYRVIGEGAMLLDDQYGQRVKRDGQRVNLLLGDFDGEAAADEEIVDALLATPMYPAEDKQVAALAKTAVGNAWTTREKVARLTQFVSGYIEDAYTGDALSVHEIINRRRGDCSDHARLFTTLARSLGIPARPASGLVYMGDEHQAFGGHDWNEVVLDGEWVGVDPTFNSFPVTPWHIRIAEDDFLKVFGQLDFEVVSITH